MENSSSFSVCRYCGGEFDKSQMSDEHIFQEALGGTEKISNVCKFNCNNGILSTLDQELISKSHLSIAGAHFGKQKIREFWDVDSGYENLLIEAKYDRMTETARTYPQLILDPGRFQIRGDIQEFEEIGSEEFQRILITHILEKFQLRDASKRPTFLHEKIRRSLVPSFYRLPPRIYVTHPINKLKQRHFVRFRYLHDENIEPSIRAIENWDKNKSFAKFEERLGVKSPSIQLQFDRYLVLRALMKIGINALSHECTNTFVDRNTFEEVIKIVLGETPLPPEMLKVSGFVSPFNFSKLSPISNSHQLWLSYESERNLWKVYISFYGASLCAVVRFPGPNQEAWRCREITVMLNDSRQKWMVRELAELPDLSTVIEWIDPRILTPWLRLENYVEGILD